MQKACPGLLGYMRWWRKRWESSDSKDGYSSVSQVSFNGYFLDSEGNRQIDRYLGQTGEVADLTLMDLSAIFWMCVDVGCDVMRN